MKCKYSLRSMIHARDMYACMNEHGSHDLIENVVVYRLLFMSTVF